MATSAACITCFSGTLRSRAARVQSSYSGIQFRSSPLRDPIFTRIIPYAVSTSTNRRCNMTRSSSRTRTPSVVVSRNSRDSNTSRRSGRQSKVRRLPKRPFFQNPFHHMRHKLGRRIVNSAFQNRNTLTSRLFRTYRFANTEPQHIGKVFRIACSRAVPDDLRSHNRDICKFAPESPEQSRTCRRSQFFLNASRVHRNAFQQLRRCRRGDRKQTMRALHKSATHIHRRRVPAIDAKRTKSSSSADNIGDRIDRTHFMKVHRLNTNAMNLRLSLCQQLESLQRKYTRIRGKRRPLDQLANLLPAPSMHVLVFVMFVRVLMIVNMFVLMILGMRMIMLLFGNFSAGCVKDVDFCGGDAAAVHRGESKLRADVESLRGFLKERARNAGIDERAEQHVSTDAGETFKITNSHALFSSRLRQHLDRQDFVHRPGAVTIAIHRDIVKSRSPHSFAHLPERLRRKRESHFTLSNFNASDIPMVTHTEISQSQTT